MDDTPLSDSERVTENEKTFLYDLNVKRRKPNFTEPELATLVDLWAQYKTILRGPATDTVMRSTKARVWRKITDEMNRRYPFVLRRVCDIRGKWEKLMCEARTCLKVKGLQPCRGQPAISTQRKRPSRILRHIMLINWPNETDLLQSGYEAAASSNSGKGFPDADSSTSQPAMVNSFLAPVTPLQQFPQPPTPPVFSSVQSIKSEPDRVDPCDSAPIFSPDQTVPAQAAGSKLPRIDPPSSTSMAPVDPLTSSSLAPVGPRTSISMAPVDPLTSSSMAPVDSRTSTSLAPVGPRTTSSLAPVDPRTSTSLGHVDPRTSTSSASADLQIDCVEETDDEVRRDILRLQRTRLQKEIEKLDLEILLLRKRHSDC